ncbi:MAG: catechol 1,2-dioxygenase [Rhodobacteraceae bacterium]|nr:MAG: catechol 1,2-dioxygenase [Paracoccaceae bacterium]
MIRTEADITPAVLAVMEQTTDPRLREIMKSLVNHLHGFIREVRLTEAEFRTATAILNDLGQFSNDSHNEPVLMAGSLGVSSLVCLLNNGNNGTTETTQNLLGPFWRMHSPPTKNGETLVRSETLGEQIEVEFEFVDVDGKPIEGAEVDIWHSSPVGLYENQDPEQADYNLRGKFTTDASGKIWFRSVRPSGYPIPTNTVVGQLLKAQNRHPNRPAHIHALAFKKGFKTMITQIYSDDDPVLESDVQFGVTAALTGKFERHDTANQAEPTMSIPWFSLHHRLVLEAGEAKLPLAPIK